MEQACIRRSKSSELERAIEKSLIHVRERIGRVALHPTMCDRSFHLPQESSFLSSFTKLKIRDVSGLIDGGYNLPRNQALEFRLKSNA